MTRKLRAGDIFNVSYGRGTALMDENRSVIDISGEHMLLQLSESFNPTQSSDCPLTVHFVLTENGRVVLHYACTGYGSMQVGQSSIELLHS